MSGPAALVTGANGFVGGFLCPHLRANGWTVYEAVYPAVAGPRRVPCDITDPKQLEALFSSIPRVTHVFHLAAVTFVPFTSEDPALTMRVNLLGTMQVAAAMHRYAPNARLLFIGSAAAYGIPRHVPVTEDEPLRPREPYAISKAAADAFCDYFHRATGMDIVRLRPFNHSGPGQPDQFVLSSFARQVARIATRKADPVVRVGNLDVSRDFLHIDDVVRAYESAAKSARPGEVYNVCSGQSRTIRQALEILIDLAGVPVRIEVDAERLRSIEIPDIAGSHEKLTRDTGWKPEIPFARLLEDLLEYWKTVERSTI